MFPGTSVNTYFADSDGKFNARQILTVKSEAGRKISSVVPADFNGDLLMDLLVTFSDNSAPARIYWGDGNTVASGMQLLHWF